MPRATLPHPQRERGLVGGEEGFEWPPKVSIGESPSALSKLAALIEEHDHNELWDFVADNVVERLRASFGPLAARGPSEPELKPRARCETQSPAVRKQLRLAQALELPVRPGPLRHSAEKPAPAQPIQWLIQPQGLATAPPPAEQPGRHPAPMPARELRLLGVPWDWDFNSLTCVFKSIGLCMHCDVGMVEWEGEGKVLVKLKSDVAAQKCLELDSFVVRDGATERPLHVAPAAAALTAAAAPAAAAEPPAHGPACPAAEHAAKEEAASVQISKIEANSQGIKEEERPQQAAPQAFALAAGRARGPGPCRWGRRPPPKCWARAPGGRWARGRWAKARLLGPSAPPTAARRPLAAALCSVCQICGTLPLPTGRQA